MPCEVFLSRSFSLVLTRVGCLESKEGKLFYGFGYDGKSIDGARTNLALNLSIPSKIRLSSITNTLPIP